MSSRSRFCSQPSSSLTAGLTDVEKSEILILVDAKLGHIDDALPACMKVLGPTKCENADHAREIIKRVVREGEQVSQTV